MEAITSTFRSGEPPLYELLEYIRKGEVQLPDFQRGWVWDDDHIRSLVASVSLSYPIGAVLLFETGGDGVRFLPRPIEGVVLDAAVKPRLLILDGQQRLTSLYLALRSGKPIPTRTDKGQDITRVYYLHIAKCLDPNEDRLDAVLSVSPDRKLTSDFGRRVELDLSDPEKEYAVGCFPLDAVFDQARYNAWRRGYQRAYRQEEKRLDQFDEFESQVIQRFQQYRVPTIELQAQTPKEAVCQVFEKVNTGGVSLTVFELLTATFAADDFNLRKDWDLRAERLHSYGPLGGVESTDFLTSVTLLVSYQQHRKTGSAVSCKRKDVLGLDLNEYKSNADLLEQGLVKAARLLTREKVFDVKSLPYQTQLIPLGAICSALGDRFEEDSVKGKLVRWYWCGVFGELYGGANESRYAFDVSDVLSWLDGGEEPRTTRDANFAPARLLSLQTRLSAAYKGLMVQLMQIGSPDFLNGDPIELTNYFDLAVDIHHIFPRAYCEKQGLDRARWNSIVNKAPLTAATNRFVGGRAPKEYIGGIEKRGLSSERLDEILSGHLIAPGLLRQNSFQEFIKDRAIRLLDRIEAATGKQVPGRDSDETIQTFGAALVSVRQG